MFDFEKLEVYQHIKTQNVKVFKLISDSKKLDDYIKDQWKKASIEALLNLVEGTGRMAKQEKRHFVTIARGNIFEATAILEMVQELGFLGEEEYKELYEGYEKASKMLLGMIRSFSQQRSENYQRREMNENFVNQE
jgi:four helix bundle protein